MKFYFNISIVIILLLLMNGSISSQVSVPINKKEMENFTRECDILSFMRVNLSQTYLLDEKNDKNPENKQLVKEEYFNTKGAPEKTIFYDENKKITHIIKTNYNSNNLPFEEIKFNADNSLNSGIMYEYELNGYLKKQTNYNENSEIVSVQIYKRLQDSIIIDVLDNKTNLLYQSIMFFTDNDIDGDLISNIKRDQKSNLIKKTDYEYVSLNFLRRKTISNTNSAETYREYYYNENAVLIRTMLSDKDKNLILDSSFEYDDYGNISGITETNANRQKNTYIINHFSLKQ